MGYRGYCSFSLSNLTSYTFLLLCINQLLIRSTVYSKQKVDNFKVYWNVPTFMCHRYGFNFSTVQDQWGIIQNIGDGFRGDKISILYDPGLFPALLNTTSSSPPELRNGGVPQEGNLDLHISYLQRDIEKLIPDKSFKGVAIIDFEEWRPIWRENWSSLNMYRVYSRKVEKQNHPFWNDNMIEKEATQRFEKAAKRFMFESLELARNLRPYALWGYYGYPFCFNYTPKNNKYTCSDEVLQDNNRLKWLFEESQAIYPSMYLKSESMTELTRGKYILGRMLEANRISQRHSYVPIYPYIWYKYHDANRFLSKDDIRNSVEVPKKNGASGVIIWGATKDVNSAEKCNAVYDYLQRILGPTVQQIKNKFKILNSIAEVDYNEVMQKSRYNEIDVDLRNFVQ